MLAGGLPVEISHPLSREQIHRRQFSICTGADWMEMRPLHELRCGEVEHRHDWAERNNVFFVLTLFLSSLINAFLAKDFWFLYGKKSFISGDLKDISIHSYLSSSQHLFTVAGLSHLHQQGSKIFLDLYLRPSFTGSVNVHIL